MKRPQVEEFKRLTSVPTHLWGMADCDVVDLCDYILHLEAALRKIARLDGLDPEELLFDAIGMAKKALGND